MDKSMAKSFELRIKEIKKKLMYNYSEILNVELEHLEDDYAWLSSDKGWAQYQKTLNKRKE